MGEYNKMDWGFIFTVVGVILGVISIFSASKKITQKISPKTKSGNIDMSRSNYTIEKNIHFNANTKFKK